MKTVFFPRRDYPVEVCKHRYGRQMTYTECTDTLQQESAEVILSKALERNIRLGGFIRRNNEALSGYILQHLENGNLRLDYYFPGKQEGNPSQVYTEQEFEAAYSLASNWFYNRFNRFPSTLSYGFGYTDYSDFAKKYFLAGRISPFDTGLTDYDSYNVDTWIVRSPTYRWYDEAKTIGVNAALDILSAAIDNALEESGFVCNFTHWHQMGGYAPASPLYYSCYDRYFDMLKEKNRNNDIHFCSYGEAVEYLVFRDSIKQAVMFRPVLRPETLEIRLDVNTDGFMAKLLNTPVTLTINLTGTHLQDKEVEITGATLYSRNGNVYLLEVPYSAFAGVVLKEKS